MLNRALALFVVLGTFGCGDSSDHSESVVAKTDENQAESVSSAATPGSSELSEWSRRIKESAKKSFAATRKKAEAGDAEAQAGLSHAHAYGLGTPRSIKDSAKWMRRAAESGHRNSQYKFATALHKGYYELQHDPKQSLHWYQQAAEQGDIRAEIKLAKIYAGDEEFFSGNVQHDDKLAASWFLKAALKGSVEPQRRLGDFYMTGRGVDADKVTAYAWYRLASLNNDTKAAQAWSELMKGMSKDEIAKGETTARTMIDDHPESFSPSYRLREGGESTIAATYTQTVEGTTTRCVLTPSGKWTSFRGDKQIGSGDWKISGYGTSVAINNLIDAKATALYRVGRHGNLYRFAVVTGFKREEVPADQTARFTLTRQHDLPGKPATSTSKP